MVDEKTSRLRLRITAEVVVDVVDEATLEREALQRIDAMTFVHDKGSAETDEQLREAEREEVIGDPAAALEMVIDSDLMVDVEGAQVIGAVYCVEEVDDHDRRRPNTITPVEQAVEAFEKQALKSPEVARETFWRLLDNIKECQKRVNRSFVRMAIFALVFELLNRGLVSELSIGGLKLTQLKSLSFVLPIAIGFEVFHSMSAIRDRNIMTSTYARLSEAVYRDLHKSDIDALMILPSGFITSIFPSVHINYSAFRVAAIASALEYSMFAILLPIALPVYTIVQVFRQSGFAAWESWVSVVLTSVFIIFGFASVLFMRVEEN